MNDTANKRGDFLIELVNRTYKGRTVGNRFGVTKRPIGKTSLLAVFDTREDAAAFIDRALVG